MEITQLLLPKKSCPHTIHSIAAFGKSCSHPHNEIGESKLH